MRRLKVLFITEWYPSAGDPIAGVFVREHAHAVGLYDDVSVLHLAGRDPSLRKAWHLYEETNPALTQGIPTYRLSRQRLLFLPAYLAQVWGVWRAARWLAARGFRADVIHAHVYAAGVPAALLARLWRVPLVITEHLSAFPRRTLRPLDVMVARLAFGAAVLVLPVSRYLQHAIEAYGIHARFRVMPNAVNVALFRPTDGPESLGQPTDNPEPPSDAATGPSGEGQGQRILYVGRLPADQSKGVPYLLRALAQLTRPGPAWHLEIVGDGPGRGELEELAARLGLGARVSFLGAMSKTDVARRMQNCSFLVFPSCGSENLPVVLIEALASGKPIVATCTGGTAEIVNENVGLLVPPGDADALAGAIADMLENSHEYPPQRLSQYAHERYSYEAVGRQLDHIYREVCASR